MNKLQDISNIYFLGIGGIGMSALARYFHEKGVKVSGYDKTETPLTLALKQEGISVHYDDDVQKADMMADIVVYTPAIPAEHTELHYYKSKGYTLLKRSEVLGMITESSFNICVAGTHGKTTTSAMIAHILRDTKYGCNAFLGGVTVNYNTNFWSSENNVSVAEADEYDRSFLKLFPDVAIITSMDPDHLDIYGTEENMQEAFIGFTGNIKSEGCLVKKFGLKRTGEFKAHKQITYSLNDERADVHAKNITINNGAYHFDMISEGKENHGYQLNMGGLHNIENAMAAITVAKQLSIDDTLLQKALADFKGVKRRFEYVIKNEQVVYIDDYAHHPEELRALINSARDLFPERACTIIFQPHLYTRTRDLADGFAEVLDLADEIILLPIYPARELPIEGVSSEMILSKMKNPNTRIVQKSEVENLVRSLKPSMLITAGAGDIDTIVTSLKNVLES